MAIDLSVFLLPVRAVQAVFSIIVLGTLAYSTYLSPHSFPHLHYKTTNHHNKPS